MTMASLSTCCSRATGVLLGATFHDVAQVVRAEQAVSETVGNTAVIGKFFRAFMLLPVVMAVGFHFDRRGGHMQGAKVPVPAFAMLFLVFVVITSLAPLPQSAKTPLVLVSNWGLLIAIAALSLAPRRRRFSGSVVVISCSLSRRLSLSLRRPSCGPSSAFEAL